MLEETQKSCTIESLRFIWISDLFIYRFKIKEILSSLAWDDFSSLSPLHLD